MNIFKWIKNHLLLIVIIFFIITIIFITILDNLYECFGLNEFLNDNAPIIELFIWISSIGGIVTLYKDFLVQKQHEAVFGFYSNMRFFLKRLNVFLGKDFSKCDIFVKLYTHEAFKANCSSTPTEEHINAFRTLCFEFLNFLSNSKDNIPTKRGTNEFTDWYQHQLNIVELLQKGAFFTINSHGDCSDKEELEAFYDQIKKDIKDIDNNIKEKIEEDSML